MSNFNATRAHLALGDYRNSLFGSNGFAEKAKELHRLTKMESRQVAADTYAIAQHSPYHGSRWLARTAYLQCVFLS